MGAASFQMLSFAFIHSTLLQSTSAQVAQVLLIFSSLIFWNRLLAHLPAPVLSPLTHDLPGWVPWHESLTHLRTCMCLSPAGQNLNSPTVGKGLDMMGCPASPGSLLLLSVTVALCSLHAPCISVPWVYKRFCTLNTCYMPSTELGIIYISYVKCFLVPCPFH